MKLIKVLSHNSYKVTDENALILVTDQGAWNVVTGEIGGTGPQDCITDTQRISVPYEPPNEEKISFLTITFMGKIIPEGDMCTCFLQHRSTALIGGTSRKWFEVDIGLRMFTV